MKTEFDSNFYRRAYPDLRFIPDDRLEDHYKMQGVNENRLPNEHKLMNFIKQLPFDFDCRLYRKLYPDVPSNTLHSFLHYYMHGQHEKRVYNKTQLEFKNKEVLDKISLQNNYQTKPTKNYNTTFNIVIRTHNRPEMFDICYESILDQTYKNYKIYIIYQDIDSDSYILSYASEKTFMLKGNKINNETNYYDDYCNQILPYINEGWIIYLDDDNRFVNSDVLSFLDNEIGSNPSSKIITTGFARTDNVIFPDISKPTLGQLDTANFCIKNDIKNYSKWTTNRDGDYYYFSKLLKTFYKNIIETKFISINVQYTDRIANYGTN